MKISTKDKAFQILISIETLEQAKNLLLVILKDRPSTIVNAYDFLTNGSEKTVKEAPAEITINGESFSLNTEGKSIEQRHDECIARYLSYHTFIATIKWYRLLSGQGLKEARDKIDYIRAQYDVAVGINTTSYPVTVDDYTILLIRLIWEYGKEEAIKHVLKTKSHLTPAAASLTVDRCIVAFDLQY